MTRNPAPHSVRSDFSHHHTLRAVLDAVLEGRMGRLLSSENGRCHRADVGCYSFFGGDAEDGRAHELLSTVPAPRELVGGDSGAWREQFAQVRSGELSPRPMRFFRGSQLDPSRLQSMAVLPPSYTIATFDEELATQLSEAFRPHALLSYDDVGHFLEQGFGIAALRGAELASAATSYTVCSHGAEIAISTHPDHRSRGLARAIAASMCLATLERGLEPHWNASNPVSQRLAQTLGFIPDRVVEIEYLER